MGLGRIGQASRQESLTHTTVRNGVQILFRKTRLMIGRKDKTRNRGLLAGVAIVLVL